MDLNLDERMDQIPSEMLLSSSISHLKQGQKEFLACEITDGELMDLMDLVSWRLIELYKRLVIAKIFDGPEEEGVYKSWQIDEEEYKSW